MNSVIFNKNVTKPDEITNNVFSDDDIVKYGEIILCSSIEEPGLYIFTKSDLGESKIQKINGVHAIKLDTNIDPFEVGNVVSGDSLSTIVSKLQNQINSLDSKIENVFSGYALTKVAISNGKISGRTQTDVINSPTTAADSALVDGTSKSDLFTGFSSPGIDTTSAPDTKIIVGGTEKSSKINADLVDGYHIVVGSTGNTANTIYIL